MYIEAFARLSSVTHPPANWAQLRGLAFERHLHDVLKAQLLQPRTSFRPSGEQVDGSFLHRGRIYLLEAKWTKDSLPASSIYAFKGKVDGKLIGTVGIYISMAGYDEDTVNALVVGKDLNVLLFDSDDWLRSLKSADGFARVLDYKLRAAAEEGTPFAASSGLLSASTAGDSLSSVAIVTEGRMDEHIVQCLIRRLTLQRPVRVVNANGAANLPRIVRLVVDLDSAQDVIAVVDDDAAGAAAELQLREAGPQVFVVRADPYLDVALADEIRALVTTMDAYRAKPYDARVAIVRDAIANMPLPALLQNATIRRLLKRLSDIGAWNGDGLADLDVSN
jgi:hypothetical protein